MNKIFKIVYPEDCIFLYNLLIKKGIYMDIPTIQQIWFDYSDNSCAYWLNVNDSTTKNIEQYIKENYDIS